MQPWWSMRGPERVAAKAADERIRVARKGRQALRRYHRDGDTGFYVGADGERFQFPATDKELRRAAQSAARQTFDKILGPAAMPETTNGKADH